MDSPSIANDIAEFIFRVKALKDQRKAYLEDVEDSGVALGYEDVSESDMKWREREEFEGRKTYTPSQGKHDYQYLHGPLCNALHRKLDDIVKGHPNLQVGKHRVDLALVDKSTGKATAIFEVKTSGSMSAQLYTAFGQFAYYQHRFGTSATKLFLVLPASTASDFSASEFFAHANIQVFFGEKGIFENSNGKNLEQVLSNIL
ncbi:hypothetical protein RSA46_21190 [Pseudomonas oryzihabitans]|nr:hypothetical protein RSA46_21190 [Pseudomonas psychrotolerans]